MATIHIDGKTVQVDGADNLLQACLSLGIDVPYFCYHPALGSVGSCRQCAVKQYMSEDDYKAGRGRLVMSCMVAPTDNMYISVDDEEAKAFRRHIVEYLMTNHPHDCPTCEEGGHCHLQDMTYMSGQNRRRYRFSKRTHHNQNLGAFINHEMNRCIACYRCVRFYNDYAGGTDFGVYASANRVYFGRESDGQLQSEFSGNLTEVCPTGVFTDKTHSDRYNRKWDMQYAPSICMGCSTGCNISAGERYGELRRIENRYNPDVNGYFLCDKGRFGYGYVNRGDRPLQPLENIEGTLVKTSADLAVDDIAVLINGKKLIGIGSPTASIENNFALKKLVGADNYSTGERLFTQNLVKSCLAVLQNERVYNVSLAQIEKADAIFVIGEDITQTASRVALSIRQATKNKMYEMADALKTEHWLAEPVKRIGQNHYSPLYLASVNDTKLDDVAKVSLVANPADIIKLVYAVAQVIEHYADDLADIHQSEQAQFAKETNTDDLSDDELMDNLAHHIAYDLMMASRPLLVSGASLDSVDMVNAVGHLAGILTQKRAKIDELERISKEVAAAEIQGNAKTPTHDPHALAKPENNATPSRVIDEARLNRTKDAINKTHNYADKTGVYMVLPHANSVGVALLGGLSLDEIVAKADDCAVLVLENDLFALSASMQEKLLANDVIVLDYQRYDWHDRADFVLSSASFAEGDGTLVSAEGRAQRYFAVYDKRYYEPHTDIKDAWRWCQAIGTTLGLLASDWHNLDDVIADIAKEYADLALMAHVAPSSDYRITGLKVARESRRYSGRTAMRARLSIHEPMQPKDTDTALTFSMEGYVGNQTDSSVLPFVWAAGWNSPQALNKFQDKVGGRLKGGDVGIRLFDFLPKNTVNFDKKPVAPFKKTSVFEGVASLVPVYDMLASSKMAMRSRAVAEQMAGRDWQMAWTISYDDALRWQIKAGDKLLIGQNGREVVLPVVLTEYLAEGCIGFVAGQLPFMAGQPSTVKKVDDDTPVFVPNFAWTKPLPVSLFEVRGFNNGIKPVGVSVEQGMLTKTPKRQAKEITL